MALTLTIRGRPVTKKNHQRIVNIGGHPRVLPSAQYMGYARDAAWQIPGAAKKSIDYPVNLRCVYYMPDRRRVDLVNLLEATCDILRDNAVIKDDNCTIVASHDGSMVRYDKENPRVEITIEEVNHDD